MSDTTREQRLAAIEHVVAEYTGAVSAAHYTLFGSAPWKLHAEKALLLHYRNIDAFLLGGSAWDQILATSYLEPGREPTWDLPCWRSELRDRMRCHLDHLGYFRLAELPWSSHRLVPLLDSELRTAWKQFYDAITDGEYRREFVKQVEARRRELVPFHIRVDLLYI